MLLANLPTKFLEIFAKNAGALVRAIPLTTVTFGAASLDLGFPPETQIPTSGGGIPPDIRDANGMLQMLSAWSQWQAAGGIFVPYDATFQTAITGYPFGSVVQSLVTPGLLFVSNVDGNTTNPDAAGAGWSPASAFGLPSTGDVKLTYKTTADFAWVLMNDGSIGDASSNATTLASPTALALFTLMFLNITDTWAPLKTSGGGATNRAAFGGANPAGAAAAWAAHTQLFLPAVLGRALAVSGAGAGGLTARALGEALGEEKHTMTLAELVQHHHTWGYGSTPIGSTGSVQADRNSVDSHNITGDTGSSAPFNVMQPSSFLNAMVKL